MKLTMLKQQLHAYFHLNIMIQYTTPARRTVRRDFGVQHQLMLIWIGKLLVSVMTCVRLKVFISIVAVKIDI